MKNKEIKKDLVKRIELVQLALVEREELLAQEEIDSDEQLETLNQEIEEVVVEYTPPATSNNSGSSNSNESSNSDNTTIRNRPSGTGNLSNSTEPSAPINQTPSNNSQDSSDNESSGVNPVVETYTETVETELPFERVEVEDENQDIGYESVLVRGEYGISIITNNVTKYRDGYTERTEISRETVINPITQVTVVGTGNSESGE